MVRSSEPLLLHAMLALRLLLLCLHPHTAALWAMRYHIDKAEADPFVRIKSILEVIAYLSPRAAAQCSLSPFKKLCTNGLYPPHPHPPQGVHAHSLQERRGMPSNSTTPLAPLGYCNWVCDASSYLVAHCPFQIEQNQALCM